MHWVHDMMRVRIALLGVVLMAGAACANTAPASRLAYRTTTTCSGTAVQAGDEGTLTCPRGWAISTSPTVPNEVLVTSQHLQASMVVAAPVGRITAPQYGTLLQARMSAMGATHITITLRNTPFQMGPNVWTLTATGIGTRGTTDYTVQQYVMFHTGARSLVVLFAPTTSSAKVENVLHAMLASVTFP